MGAGSRLGKGKVINNSDGWVWCWVQDDGDPEIYPLAPNFQSPKDVDVDLVKAMPPGSLDGHVDWIKFHDYSTVTVTGSFPKMSASVSKSLWKTWKSDAEALKDGGAGGTINDYLRAAPGWGEYLG